MDSSTELFSKICRICLSANNSRTVPLFESNGISSCYGQAIAFCTKEALPHLEYAPNNMCYDCLRQLRHCILFQKKCRNSQNYFEQIKCNTHLLSNIKDNIIINENKNDNDIFDDINDNSGRNTDLNTKHLKSIINDYKVRMEPVSSINKNDDINNYNSDNDTTELFNDLFDIKEAEDTRAISEKNNVKMILPNDNKDNDNIFNVIEEMIQNEVNNVKNHNQSESSDEILAMISKNKQKSFIKRFKNGNTEQILNKRDFSSNINTRKLKHTLQGPNKVTANNELSQINEQNNKSNPEFTNLENKTIIIEKTLELVNHKKVKINSKKPADIIQENKIDIINLIRDIENKNFAFKYLNGNNDLLKPRKHEKNVKRTIKMKPIKKQTKAQKMICDSCNKTFANRNSLLKHLERHAGVTAFVCELCGKGFVTKAELGVHLVLSHDTGRHYPCDECGYKAPRLFDLTEHKRVHTGERPFACDKCGLTFRRQYVWQQHQKYHTEKTLQCPKCPLKFHKVSALRSHENCVHERKYVYNCPICGTTYAQNKSVRRHLLETHGVVREKQGKIKRVLVNNVINEIPT